jgi:hypothetical protein
LWTHYDYTKAGSGETTRGYLRSLSLGQVFTWAGILDVYTSNGSLMGTVQGCWMTLSPSKFEFYSAEGRSLGTAYMDANKMGFTIVSAGDERTVAKFTRMSVPNQTDYWYLNIYEDDIAPELLLTFGAFAVDNQGEFRVDN